MQSTQSPVNPRWLAPEILAGARATTASDVFSYGERLLLAMLHNMLMCARVCGLHGLVLAATALHCAHAQHRCCRPLPGVILYELLTWTVPWGGADFWEVRGLGCWALLRRAASEQRSVPGGCGFADLSGCSCC